MPNTREKLIELVDNYTDPLSVRDLHKADFTEKFADHLIANGVTIPVRCKDCKHRHKTVSGLKICSYHITMDAKDDDFCSFGERRNDG